MTSTKMKLEFGARADGFDFRDERYEPSLREVPETLPPGRFRELGCPVLWQGVQAACTGFSLATVANFLFRQRARGTGKATEDVSPEMLYAMARRYDEYPGTNHNGSSIRGAIKGWHRHGVCSKRVWENEQTDGITWGTLGVLTRARARDASTRPLGAYYRVDPHDLDAVHCAMAEVGVLLAAINTHDGWFDLFHPHDGGEIDPILATLIEAGRASSPVPALGPEGAAIRNVDPKAGLIPWPAPDSLEAGLHAVAVIGYDEDGIWIQNSLGERWGDGGIARLAWDDWLANAADAWVLRLGAPARVGVTAVPTGKPASVGRAPGSSVDDGRMRPHLLAVGLDGHLMEWGEFATTRADVASMLRDEFRMQTETWSRRRLVVIASSGIHPVENTIRSIGGLLDTFLAQEIYPLLLLWNQGFAGRLAEIVERGWSERRAMAKDGRPAYAASGDPDASVEAMCRRDGGWIHWEHVKRMAERTVEPDGAVTIFLDQLDRAFRDASLQGWPFEVHLVGESSAACVLAQLTRKMTAPREQGGFAHAVSSMTLCAPALTLAQCRSTIVPALREGTLQRLSVVTLSDAAERTDGFAGVYRGSLLRLISHALEEDQRIPPADVGTPMLGLARSIDDDPEIRALLGAPTPPVPQGRAVEHIVLDRGAFDGSAGQLHGRLLQGQTDIHWLLARVLEPLRTSAATGRVD